MKYFSRTFGMVLSTLVLAVVGCGEPRGSVSGKVTYKDKALAGGTVVFVSEDKKNQDRALIQPDGTYLAKNVPVGKVRVGVEPAPKGASANMPKGAKKPDIPADSLRRSTARAEPIMSIFRWRCETQKPPRSRSRSRTARRPSTFP